MKKPEGTRLIEKPKPMKTVKARNDRKNWSLIEIVSGFGIPTRRFRVCPTCSHYHEVTNLGKE